MIMLMQTGGPSNMDLFDRKPELERRNGEPHSGNFDTFQQGNTNKLMGAPFGFKHYGRCGMELSEIIPHVGSVADELCLVPAEFWPGFLLPVPHDDRYLPYLSETGYLVTNITPFVNIPNYPEISNVMEEIRKFPRYIAIDADAIAKEVGSSRASNMVMLGAASPFIDIEFSKIEDGIRTIFGRKGEDVVNMNLEALRRGRQFAEENR